MAVLCEKVLQEKDGVLSLVRIVDRFITHGETPEMPPKVIDATLVVVFKSGSASGKHIIKIRLEKPSGLVMPAREYPVLFEGEDRGVGIVSQMSLVLDEEGLYWIDVLFEESVVTRIPLRVLYQRVAPSPQAFG